MVLKSYSLAETLVVKPGKKQKIDPFFSQLKKTKQLKQRKNGTQIVALLQAGKIR